VDHCFAPDDHRFWRQRRCRVSKSKENWTPSNQKSWSQFHQHFTTSFFMQKYFSKLFSTYSFVFVICVERIIAQKLILKCWWNLLKEWRELFISWILTNFWFNNSYLLVRGRPLMTSQFFWYFSFFFVDNSMDCVSNLLLLQESIVPNFVFSRF